MSDIDAKYDQLGGSGSFLGEPAEEERACDDGMGCCRHYKGGSIYWHPYTGAHAVSGAIRGFWANQNWEQGPLGYPMSDELTTPADGRYIIFEGGVVYQKPNADAEMAFSVDIPLDTIIEAVDAQVEEIIEDTSLSYAGQTDLNRVHEWYEHEGRRYYRVMQLSFDMEVEVKVVDLRPAVGLDLYFNFEVLDGSVVVTLIRENHFIISDEASGDAPSWKEKMSSGFDEWKEKLNSGYKNWKEKLDSGVEDRKELLKEGWEDTKEMLSSGFQDTKDLLASGIEETVGRIVDRKLAEQVEKALGKSVTIPAGANLLAAQLQEEGVLRLYFGD